MKTIFWNVDTQFDFMRDDKSFKGALPVPEARSIEPVLESLTHLARDRGIQIVFTGDWHTPESQEFSDKPDYKDTYPPHCLIGTKGAEYVPATAQQNPFVIDWRQDSFHPDSLKKHEGDIVLYKDAFDVFAGPPQSPHADTFLKLLSPDRAIVYGVATNVCVNFAVIGLRIRGVEVYAVTDAIKELPGLPLEKTLAHWENQGTHLISASEVNDYI